MSDARITIPTADGPMDAFVAAPDPAPAGRGPAVVVVQEAFGVNDHVRDVCRRLAGAGYVALAPEIFHRDGAGLEIPYGEGPRAMDHLGRLTNAGIETDLAAAFATLRADPRVDSARVGLVGFCVGGFAAFLGACRLDPRATVAFYAGGLVRERPGALLEPLLAEAGGIAAPLLCLFGADDGGIPPADVDAVRGRLAEVGASHEVVVYEGARHAFFNDLRPANYDAAAAHAAWERTLAWFARHLAAGAGTI
jgi:carboxymethylenebutenolidase